MQLKLRVNNRETVTGAVRTKGILNAIINVFVHEDGRQQSGRASIHAYDFSESSEWEAGEFSVGDKIEIQLLPDHYADPPTKTQQSSAIPALLFSDPNQARRALAAIHVCNEQLQGILRTAGTAEPHDEALNIQRAVAALVQDLGKYFITPTLNRHPELLAEAKNLGLTD